MKMKVRAKMIASEVTEILETKSWSFRPGNKVYSEERTKTLILTSKEQKKYGFCEKKVSFPLKIRNQDSEQNYII